MGVLDITLSSRAACFWKYASVRRTQEPAVTVAMKYYIDGGEWRKGAPVICYSYAQCSTASVRWVCLLPLPLILSNLLLTCLLSLRFSCLHLKVSFWFCAF